MIFNQKPLALSVEMDIKRTNPALVGTCSKSAGEKITGIQRRTWDTGILWDTEPGYSKARCRTLTPETQWWAMGGAEKRNTAFSSQYCPAVVPYREKCEYTTRRCNRPRILYPEKSHSSEQVANMQKTLFLSPVNGIYRVFQKEWQK